MPWRPQGLHNLRWWQGMAQAPVVAIGGVLEPEQVHAAAACGVDGVCVVRALGDTPMTTVPALQQAMLAGSVDMPKVVPSMPSPSLDAARFVS
jgi:thiamine monophosphate synthase